MAKFCNSCGAQLDDNTTFCNNCGTKVEAAPQAATTNATPSKAPASLPKFDKNMLKFIVPAAAAIIVLIIVISVIAGNGYKKPFKNMVNGINDGDEEVYCDALPDFLIKKYDKANENYYKNVRENIKKKIKNWEDSEIYDIGDDPEVSYEIIDKIELTEEDLDDIQSSIKRTYDKKVEVTNGYSVAFVITIEGEDGEYSYPEVTNVYKIDGKWCVLDTYCLVDSSAAYHSSDED